jgi:hypothetical protein
VFLTQHHIQVPPPVLIALAKPTVAISLGMCLPVFFPQQLQRQMAMLLQLLMNRLPVWLWPLPHRSGWDGLVPKQPIPLGIWIMTDDQYLRYFIWSNLKEAGLNSDERFANELPANYKGLIVVIGYKYVPF